jgi:serine phosphatase RsbU (regulator of sigma subunit)/anti-sigma regulatory factor (Ser/Thr protein kinase)
MPHHLTLDADRVHATFPPAVSSVSAARGFVRRILTGWGAGTVVDDAVLLVSELVTNAIVHAGTETEVACSRLDGAVRVEVSDRHPSRTLPSPTLGQDATDSEGGRGLFLSATLASAWGVQYTPAAKQVWFALDLPDATPHRCDTHGLTVAPPVTGYQIASSDDGHEQDANSATTLVAGIGLDNEGRVRDWPPAAVRLFGWQADEVTGKPLADLVDYDYAIRDDAIGNDAIGNDVDGEERTGSDDPPDTVVPPYWQGDYAVRHREGHDVGVTATHVRAAGDTGPAVVALLVARPRLVPAQAEASAYESDAEARAWEEARAWDDLVEDDHAKSNLDELAQRTVERARDLFDADAAFMLLVGDGGSDLELRAVTGIPMMRPWLVAGGAPMPPPIAAQRIDLTPLPGVHEDITASPGIASSFPLLTGSGMRALLTVPLAVSGRLSGMLGIAARHPGAYTNDDAMRLQQVTDRIAQVVENSRLAELERLRRGTLSFIAEASDLLAGTLDADRTVALAAQLVVPRLATWCTVHIDDEAGNRELRHAWHEDEDRHDGLVRLVTTAGPPPTARETHPWPRLVEVAAAQDTEPADRALVSGEILVLPLTARNRTLGTLTLGGASSGWFRREVVEMAVDLSRRVALTLDNALLYAERERASALLQRSLLPPGMPTVPGVDVHVIYQANGEQNEAGGDFYDLFEIRAGLWGFAIGDVCGTGPEAAAVTGLARHALRLLAREGMSIPKVLQRLNEAILDEGDRARFLTLVYGELEPQPDGSLSIAMACAGHPLPLVLRTDGSVRAAASPQPLLGVMPSLDLYTEEIELEPGEALLGFTDGVTERRYGLHMFGEEGLTQVFTDCVGLSAAAVATRVRRAVEAFSPEPRADDMAILVLRAMPIG